MLGVLGVREVLGVLKVLAIVAALGVIAGCAGSPLSVKLAVFNTVDEARNAGAIQAGWVPDGLPGRTSDLRAGYMPDGRHWGVFAFPSSEEAALRRLARDEITSGTLECDPPGRLEFWPRLLRTPIDIERVRATGFRLYRGGDSRTYAINWGQGRAYYWK